MKTKRVTVRSYDPQWALDFQKICRELEEALGEYALRIAHVGSTSVSGLSAKPIIDIDVVMESYGVFPEVRRRLAVAGYLHEGDLGIPGREAFCYEGKSHLRKHHLYVCPADSRELYRHLTFRDYLRSHPEEAGRYGAVKEEAARLFPDSIEQYMAYKAEIIGQIYVKCGLAETSE